MELRGLVKRGRNDLGRGEFDAAIESFRAACSETHSIDPEYDSWISLYAEAHIGAQHGEQAGFLRLYLHDFDGALQAAGTASDGRVRAHILEQAGRHREAAEVYQAERLNVAAAIAFEKAALAADAGGGKCAVCEEVERRRKLACKSCGAVSPLASDGARELALKAKACWSFLKDDRRVLQSLYVRSLVYFNLGYSSVLAGEEDGQRHLVAAQRLLEEAADKFETEGLRERAFDCYQLLLEVGRRSVAFENLAEGYLNCIRVLKEDGLKYYVLQFYEDFVRQALSRGEFQAAASLYREASEYALRMGMPYERYYLRLSAETWMRSAKQLIERERPPEMAENGYLAAIECFNGTGDYEAIGRAYGELAALPLSKRRQERYREITLRYEHARSQGEAEQSVPAYLRQAHAYPEIWSMDLIEWERQGDPKSTCAAVIGDRRYPDVVRRRALNVALYCADRGLESVEDRAWVARSLGDLQIYSVLGPLERLFETGEAMVQQGVMRALRVLFFKRSFGVLRKGLHSASEQVLQAAMDALARLRFTHAFDPLVRIFRQFDSIEIRRVALASIGRIPTIEAGDFLIEVLRHEGEPFSTDAAEHLSRFENLDVLAILRQHYEYEEGPLRQKMGNILREAGRV
jgi:hypothetical protein